MTTKTFTRDSYYEYTDLDRIEDNIIELTDYIQTYINPSIPTYTEYSTSRTTIWIPSDTEWNYIENGMKNLGLYAGFPTGFSVFTGHVAPFGWSYLDANRWEKNLILIDNQNDVSKICGRFSCSEGDLIYGLR